MSSIHKSVSALTAALVVAGSILLLGAPASGRNALPTSSPANGSAARSGPKTPAAPAALAPYSGLGTWIDLYNAGPWKNPRRAIGRMAADGAQNLFLETSSYKFKRAIVHPKALGRLLDLAHAEGMTVVAWYVPSFKALDRDLKRATAALQFVSPSGGRFDSFALDIEATVVSNVNERNHRVHRLSRRIRAAAGSNYPLGAIIPDPVGSVYWTDFPYKGIANNFDVVLPMCYFTYRVKTAKAVYKFVREGIHDVHARTGEPHASVHPIGGLADAAHAKEVRAYVGAVFDGHAIGGSLYDFPITRASEWKALARLRTRRQAVASSRAR